MKKIAYLVIIFIIISAGTFYVMTRQKKLPPVEVQEKISSQAPAKDISQTQVKDYTFYLQQYQEGKRIQFDDKCEAIPNELTVPNTATIMLDNRTNQARQISIQSNSIKLDPY